MTCPDCSSEVEGQVAFCFSCLRHVPAEALAAARDEATAHPKVEADPDGPKTSRSWEPGILGTVEAFGPAAAISSWCRSKAEAAN